MHVDLVAYGCRDETRWTKFYGALCNSASLHLKVWIARYSSVSSQEVFAKNGGIRCFKGTSMEFQ